MKKRPNILWICTDQQRYDTLGCTGNKFVRTPNIDALANDGIVFDRMYTVSPVCGPSRAAFLSGRYPHNCGVRQNGQDISENEYLLPRMLADNGYTCGLSGKLHISACHFKVCKDTERRIDDGYSFFSWSHHPARPGKGNWSGNDYTKWLIENGVEYKTEDLSECRYVQKGMPAEYSQTAWCFNEAMRFIDMQEKERPWFFSLNCYDPHHPFDPPYEYLKRYLEVLDTLPLPDYKEGELLEKSLFQRKDHNGAYDMKGNYPYSEMTDTDRRYITAAYYAMIDQIDDNVGRIVSYLKEKGIYDDTVIIYTSDHGESLGDHGIYLKGPYCYESGVRVPFIIKPAAYGDGGIRRSAMAELIDVAPTVCETVGIPLYEGFQGRSFAALLEKGAEDRHRSSVYCEFYNSNVNHTDPKAFVTMVFDGRWKIVKAHSQEGDTDYGCELYDLEKDPGEHINLYYKSEYAEQRMRMLSLLCDRMAGTLDPLPVRRAFW